MAIDVSRPVVYRETWSRWGPDFHFIPTNIFDVIDTAEELIDYGTSNWSLRDEHICKIFLDFPNKEAAFIFHLRNSGLLKGFTLKDNITTTL